MGLRFAGGCNCCGGGTGPPLVINIPGCVCQGTPPSLAITVGFYPPDNAGNYGNSYQSGQLAYYTTTPPGYLPQASFAGAGYYSTSAWLDNSGTTNYYRMSCSSNQYSLGLGQYSGGRWQSPSQIYTWAVGGQNSANTCSPFALTAGRVQPGVYFNGYFTVGQ